MRKTFICLAMGLLTAWGTIRAQEAVRFENYFVDKTLRIDYVHLGDSDKEAVALDRLYEEGIWAGSRLHLRDPFSLGRYRITVRDAEDGNLIFSKGFDSYFGEYKTSEPALRGVLRSFHESALIPFPRKKIIFGLESRDRNNEFHALFSREIDPEDPFIAREPVDPDVRILELAKSGDPHSRVDMVIVAEGYTEGEEAKLKADGERFTALFFSQEPYRRLKDRFNVTVAFKPSAESGTDEPGYGSFRRTSVGTTFDSMGSERYLLTEDNRSLRDIASRVPYDTLVIMVNHGRYGGGGIYNLFCTFTTDNPWSEYLLLHEFGHSFGGLADEYYTSETAYNEFYPAGIEPAEPNITALLDPANLKWKNLATSGLDFPTPWEKEAFDAMDTAYQKIRREKNEKIAEMKRAGAPADEVALIVAESDRLSRENAAEVDAFLAACRLRGAIGAFEGAGYAAKGLYRPALDCLMFTKGKKPLCRVCEEAVARMIEYYGE